MSLLIEQLSTFFMLMAVGLLMGVVFDVYRVFRWLLKLPGLLVHVFDLVLWLIFAVMAFVVLIWGNWGEVRFYVFLGLLLGLAVYFKFFCKKVIRLLLVTIRLLKKIGKLLLKVGLFPIKIIGAIVVVPLGAISFIFSKIMGAIGWPFRLLAKKIRPRIKKLPTMWQGIWRKK